MSSDVIKPQRLRLIFDGYNVILGIWALNAAEAIKKLDQSDRCSDIGIQSAYNYLPECQSVKGQVLASNHSQRPTHEALRRGSIAIRVSRVVVSEVA